MVGQAKEYRLTASSKWVMDYARDSCELMRVFGKGDEKVIVQFIRYEPSARFDLHLIGKPLGRPGIHPTVRVRFGTGGEFVPNDAMSGSLGDMPAIFLSGRLDNVDQGTLDFDELARMSPTEIASMVAIEPAVEAAVTSVTVRTGSRTILLELGSMGPPMAAMRKCTTDLVKGWGFDPAQQDALDCKPTPKTNPAGWLMGSDYPAVSLFRGDQAIVRFRLSIDATGMVTACAVQSAIAKGDFAEISCDRLKRRARFEPARAADGAAVPSYYVSKIVWRLR